MLRAESMPGLRVAVFAPVPGETNRFVLVLPQPDGTAYVGLTDEPADGPVPDVPEPTEPEIGFLLDVVSAAFEQPLHRSDVVGAYAGLRPLLDAGPDSDDQSTADLSRKHATLVSRTGVVTIVGGKLTTYRRMAEDAVDAAVAARRDRRRCVPDPRPAPAGCGRPGHPGRPRAAGAAGPQVRHRRRAGARDRALRHRADRRRAAAPIADGIPVTMAELVFGVTHEGAADIDDLLDRRTRIGLIPADRALAVPAAERALALVAARL